MVLKVELGFMAEKEFKGTKVHVVYKDPLAALAVRDLLVRRVNLVSLVYLDLKENRANKVTQDILENQGESEIMDHP